MSASIDDCNIASLSNHTHNNQFLQLYAFFRFSFYHIQLRTMLSQSTSVFLTGLAVFTALVSGQGNDTMT